MKTKFILHGGFRQGELQENDAFFGEIVSSAPQDAKILLVYFAKAPDRIGSNKQEDIEQFTKNKGSKTLTFEVAEEDVFPEQVRNSDVIYLHGGHSGLILEKLKRYPALKELLQDKVVAADSAGVNVLCAAFYSMKIGVQEGFGVVPIKVICHYLEENKHKLDSIKPGLETVFLREYEFKVFYT